MKKNDRVQLKNASVPELEKRVADARERLWTLERDTEQGKQKNVKEAGELRRDIARMMTEITKQSKVA